MIRSFGDKDTQALYQGKRVRRFNGFCEQAEKRLQILRRARSLNDLRGLPSNRLEALAGDRQGQFSMRPIHPGEILRDELVELGLSARAFARALDIPVNRVTQILHERRGASADTALRLARYFGTAAEFWMDLQSDYELRRARRDVGSAIEQSVHPRAA